VALLVSAGAWGAVLLRADATSDPRYGASTHLGPLTPEQYRLALRAARRAVDLDRAHLASATARVETGPVRNPNLGGMCRSGELIVIRLTGRFPQIGVDRVRMAVPPGVVTWVGITADGSTGRACRLDVGVDRTQPYRHGADLLPALGDS